MSRYYRVKTLMLKGEKGDTGYSISNIQMNDDYTLTITIENGMQFNTPPIRGEKGEQGTGIRSVELRDDYSLLFTLDNGKTLETTAILGKEFENIRKLEASATSASKIATSASTSASASAQSASEASISASESATNASTSASASAQSAKNASQSATNAQESESSASTSADTATSKATEASASATKAKECEMNAKLSETNASNSAKEAEASAVNAKASETKAEEYANNLQNSTEAISQLKEDLVANTKEDAKTKRSLSALWDLNKGISYRFEEDDSKEYQKQIPSGAKLSAVKNICGRTIVYNQHFTDPNVGIDENYNGAKITWENGTVIINGTAKRTWINFKPLTDSLNVVAKFYVKMTIVKNTDNLKFYYGWLNRQMGMKPISRGSTSLIYNQTINELENPSNPGIADFGSGAVFNDVRLKIMIVNLTQMFGSGNEPSTVEEFESIFPLDYYPYNEGTLMSMGTKEVVNVGKNMFKCEHFSASGLDGTYNPSLSNSYGTSINSTAPSNRVTVTQSKVGQTEVNTSFYNGYFCVSFNPIILNDNYTISFDVTPTKKLIDSAKIIILLNGNESINVSYTQDLQVGKTTKLYFNVDKHSNSLKYIEIRNSGISGDFKNFQIERGTTNTAYSPYHEATYTIPQAIQNLEGYGWGVNNVYNYVDYENKKFYKHVGRINLDDYTWTAYQSDIETFYYCNDISSDILSEIKSTENILSLTGVKTIYNTKVGLRLYYVKGTVLNDTNKPTGYLYYELAEPIITDISDIIGDTFQEPIDVESGGSITFKNTNGDGYQLAVPSDIQYVVSLKEVTS